MACSRFFSDGVPVIRTVASFDCALLPALLALAEWFLSFIIKRYENPLSMPIHRPRHKLHI